MGGPIHWKSVLVAVGISAGVAVLLILFMQPQQR